ncbi:TIGR02642 family protein [Aeromonas veronii]|uniref:TIGR02642 family protein n=1 Tax=Aeromonas veronii TaxID=654 RepID=UPI003D1ABFB5
MSKTLEMALRLFSPKGGLHEPTTHNLSALGRDELIGALQIASKDNPQGLQYLMADHLVDKQAIEALQAHFNDGLCNAEVGCMALAILLRCSLPEQLERLILSHPYYDKERRRAAVVMEKAKRAHRHGKDHEYLRLLDKRNAILNAAHGRCVDEMLISGRCPHCTGTGRFGKWSWSEVLPIVSAPMWSLCLTHVGVAFFGCFVFIHFPVNDI